MSDVTEHRVSPPGDGAHYQSFAETLLARNRCVDVSRNGRTMSDPGYECGSQGSQSSQSSLSSQRAFQTLSRVGSVQSFYASAPCYNLAHHGPVLRAQHRGNKCFEDFYDRQFFIGEGNFADVWAVTRKGDSDGTLYAAKVVKMIGSKASSEVSRELSQLLELPPHPNIIELRDFFLVENPAYLVTGFRRGGDLHQVLNARGAFDEPQAKAVMRGLLSGLAHMHAHGIAHRDLKLGNVLCNFDECGVMDVQIADLGMSKKLTGGARHTVCGTPMFMAPEIILTDQQDDGMYGETVSKRLRGKVAVYDEKADIWSAGVIMFMLISGDKPFSNGRGIGLYTLFQSIRKRQINFDNPVWDFVSPEACNMVNMLLEVDSSKRPTAQEALQHPWLAADDSSDDMMM